MQRNLCTAEATGEYVPAYLARASEQPCSSTWQLYGFLCALVFLSSLQLIVVNHE